MTPMSLDLKMNFLDEIAISPYQKLFTNTLFGHTRLIKPLFFIHCPTNSFFACKHAAACLLLAAMSTLDAAHPKCGPEISSMTKSSYIKIYVVNNNCIK